MKIVVTTLVGVCVFLLFFTFMSTGMTNEEIVESYVTTSSFMRSKSQLQGYIDNLNEGQTAPQPVLTGEFFQPLAEGSGYVLTAKMGWRGDSGPQGRLHKGTDIAAASGTSVSAVITGEITKNTKAIDMQRGYYAVQETGDGSWEVTYQHFSEASPISSGEIAVQGDTVGKVGNTGSSTGPHLHIEMVLRIENTVRYYDAYELIYEGIPVSKADYWIGDYNEAIKFNCKGEELGKIPGPKADVRFTDYRGA
jgi:murein DD-endopeptidase MepM/ murein hydrolase activator NlpD